MCTCFYRCRPDAVNTVTPRGYYSVNVYHAIFSSCLHNGNINWLHVCMVEQKKKVYYRSVIHAVRVAYIHVLQSDIDCMHADITTRPHKLAVYSCYRVTVILRKIFVCKPLYPSQEECLTSAITVTLPLCPSHMSFYQTMPMQTST